MADAVSRSSHKTPTHSDLIEQPRPVRLLGPLEPTSSATSGNGVETGNAGHAGRHGFLGKEPTASAAPIWCGWSARELAPNLVRMSRYQAS